MGGQGWRAFHSRSVSQFYILCHVWCFTFWQKTVTFLAQRNFRSAPSSPLPCHHHLHMPCTFLGKWLLGEDGLSLPSNHAKASKILIEQQWRPYPFLQNIVWLLCWGRGLSSVLIDSKTSQLLRTCCTLSHNTCLNHYSMWFDLLDIFWLY